MIIIIIISTFQKYYKSLFLKWLNKVVEHYRWLRRILASIFGRSVKYDKTVLLKKLSTFYNNFNIPSWRVKERVENYRAIHHIWRVVLLTSLKFWGKTAKIFPLNMYFRYFLIKQTLKRFNFVMKDFRSFVSYLNTGFRLEYEMKFKITNQLNCVLENSRLAYEEFLTIITQTEVF